MLINCTLFQKMLIILDWNKKKDLKNKVDNQFCRNKENITNVTKNLYSKLDLFYFFIIFKENKRKY